MSQFKPTKNSSAPSSNSDEDFYANESFEDDPETQEEIEEFLYVEEKKMLSQKIAYGFSRHHATTTTKSDVLAYGSSSEDDNDVVISETVAEINVVNPPTDDARDFSMTPSARLFEQATAARQKLSQIGDKNSSEFEDDDFNNENKSLIDESIGGDDDDDDTAVEDNNQLAGDDDDGDLTAVEDDFEDDVQGQGEESGAERSANGAGGSRHNDYDEDEYAMEYVYEDSEESEEEKETNKDADDKIGKHGKQKSRQGSETEQFSDARGHGSHFGQMPNGNRILGGSVKKRYDQNQHQPKETFHTTPSGMALKHVQTKTNIRADDEAPVERPRLSQYDGAGDSEDLVELYNNTRAMPVRNHIPIRTFKHAERGDYMMRTLDAESIGGSSASTRSDMSIEYSIRSHTPSGYTASRHRMHVDFVKPSSTPSQRAPLPAGKRRNLSFTNDRTREIERHNSILLTKILSQKSTYDLNPNKVSSGKFSNLPPSTRVSSAEVNRKKQQRQIDMDNQRLKRKLEAIAARKLKKK